MSLDSDAGAPRYSRCPAQTGFQKKRTQGDRMSAVIDDPLASHSAWGVYRTLLSAAKFFQ
jgi:hypothetical protein